MLMLPSPGSCRTMPAAFAASDGGDRPLVAIVRQFDAPPGASQAAGEEA
jgi:hypothetical protein